MRRVLPPKPNLEHLKSQAKVLLDAHRRGDVEALARIRGSVPAFAGMSDDELAKAPFALHDAQSAIAREYGFVSWAELRAGVMAAQSALEGVESASPEVAVQAAGGQALDPAIEAAVRKAMEQRGTEVDVPTPATVPLLPVRNAVVTPGTMVPLDINRQITLRALEAALAGQPAFIAVFAQRAYEIENPTSDDLHPNGSLCIVRFLYRVADGGVDLPAPVLPDRNAWTVIEGVRWVTLEALERVDPYGVVRISDRVAERGDEREVAALDSRLRELARRFASMLPANREQAHAAIDAAMDATQLADLVIMHLGLPVAEMVAYADETQVPKRIERAIAALERAIATLEAGLAKAQGAPA